MTSHTAMDKNNDGMCDFKEILIGICQIGNSNGGPRDTAKLLFDGYDRDKSGTLEMQEVCSFFIF